MVSENRHNNKEEWLNELKERVNSINGGVPEDGFSNVMRAINLGNLHSGKVMAEKRLSLKRILYAAAVILLFAVPAMTLLMYDNANNTSSADNSKAFAVLEQPDNSEQNIENISTEKQIAQNTNANKNIAKNSIIENSIIEKAAVYNTRKQAAENIVEYNTVKDNTVENNTVENNIVENSIATQNKSGKQTTTRQLAENLQADSKQAANKQQEKVNDTPDKEFWDSLDKQDKKSKRKGNSKFEVGMNLKLNMGINNGLAYDNSPQLSSNESVNYLAVNNGVSYDYLSYKINEAIALKEYKKTYFEYDHELPLRIGITAARKFGNRLFVETGLSYTYMSSTIRSDSYTLEQDLHYLGIPLNVNCMILDSRYVSLYTGAGINLNKCVYGDINGERVKIKQIEAAANIQAGVMVNISRHFGIYLQPSMQLRLTDSKLGTFSNIQLENYYSKHDTSFNLDGGLKFFF